LPKAAPQPIVPPPARVHNTKPEKKERSLAKSNSTVAEIILLYLQYHGKNALWQAGMLDESAAAER
jgi:hypothetical protein